MGQNQASIGLMLLTRLQCIKHVNDARRAKVFCIYCWVFHQDSWVSCSSASCHLAPAPLMVFRLKLECCSLKCYQLITPKFCTRHDSYNVQLLWHVQNFIVVSRVHFKPEHFKFWSNFEFDRNIVCGMEAWCEINCVRHQSDVIVDGRYLLPRSKQSWQQCRRKIIY